MYVLGPEVTDFPPPNSSDEDGVIAIGGDLRPERLVEAYRRGVFPWYGEGLPILWHCPNPRFVLPTGNLHVPSSLRKTLRRGVFDVRFDTAFDQVVEACASTLRPGQRGTWITRDMRKAYRRLFDSGFAHSAEAYRDGELVGGLYGVSLGAAFFGESMFSRISDASKVAFVTLVEWMRSWGVALVDCQQETAHLQRFGAENWERSRFLELLSELVRAPTRKGRWPETAASSPPVLPMEALGS